MYMYIYILHQDIMGIGYGMDIGPTIRLIWVCPRVEGPNMATSGGLIGKDLELASQQWCM